ncbi:MAG: tetratricopeptide repeat protein [Pirellulales bacterium]
MRHSSRWFYLVCGLLLGLLPALRAAEPQALAPAAAPTPAEQAPAAVDEPQAKAPPTTDLTEPDAPFVPLRPRNQGDDDHIRALALFTAGRVAEQQQKYAEALRYYQRAYRFDPKATAALKEIVPLAFSLDHQAEAVRYALILAEREPSDPVLLRRLAIYLTEEGDTERALAFYEKALTLQAQQKDEPSVLVARTEMGRLYFLAKKYDQAADEFVIVQKALDNPKEAGLDESMQKALVGKPEMTYQLMGEAFLASNRTDAALAAFDKAHAAKADDGLHAYNLARVELKRKQPAQAIARLQAYFDQHLATQGTGPYQSLADALTELGQADQLVARLEALRAGDEGNIPLSYFLAQRLAEAGQLDKAAAIYSDLIARNKERPPLEAFQGLIDVLHRQKDVDKLLAVLSEAVGRVGTFSPLGGSAKAVQNDADISAAIVAAAERKLADNPAELTYGGKLAAALLAVQHENFPAANKFFEQALAAEQQRAGETLVTWGLEMFLANQYADASKIFQRGLDEKLLKDNDAALYFYLAGALEMEGRTDEAIAAADKAAELSKDAPRFAGRAAWVAYHAKRYDEARQRYDALIERYADKHDSVEAREAVRDARLVLSNIAVLEDKQPESEQWLEDLLDEFPEDIGALNDLGYLWADSGKHLELALAMIQRAVAHDPKNMAYRDSLGWVLYRLGRYPEAVAELKAAAAADSPDGVILDHLAEASQKAGDLAGAADAWTRAAAAFDKSSEPDKAQQARDKAAQARAEKPKD